MPDSELAVVAIQTYPAPILIERAGQSTRKKFFEFFKVPIRNAHTRAAYYRAIQQFLSWCERAGYQHLEDIEPITVGAYIETLQRQAAPPTVKTGSVRFGQGAKENFHGRAFAVLMRQICEQKRPSRLISHWLSFPLHRLILSAETRQLALQ